MALLGIHLSINDSRAGRSLAAANCCCASWDSFCNAGHPISASVTGAILGSQRRRPGARLPPSSSTPTCCGRWRSPVGPRRCPSARPAALPARTARSRPPPAGRPAGLPAAGRDPAPAVGTGVDGGAGRRGLVRRRRLRDGHRRSAAGLVAAHLQWHLERGLRSLPLVDRRKTGGGIMIAKVAASDAGRRRPRGPRYAARRRTRRGPGRRRCPAKRPPACRDRDGRQRPVGQAARPAPHQGPRARRGSLFDVVEGAIELGVPTCPRTLLHRELAPLARGGALPDGLQPGRDPPPPRRADELGYGSGGPAGGRGCGAASSASWRPPSR